MALGSWEAPRPGNCVPIGRGYPADQQAQVWSPFGVAADFGPGLWQVDRIHSCLPTLGFRPETQAHIGVLFLLGQGVEQNIQHRVDRLRAK